jgi:hypothetical protein
MYFLSKFIKRESQNTNSNQIASSVPFQIAMPNGAGDSVASVDTNKKDSKSNNISKQKEVLETKRMMLEDDLSYFEHKYSTEKNESHKVKAEQIQEQIEMLTSKLSKM